MASDFVGRRLGPYHVLQRLGQGGMAVVYKAYQPALDRYVAIKVLSQALALDLEFVERFQREARAAARLNHPNIATVHDVGLAGGTHFIVMEYVDGPTLRQLLKQRGRLSLEPTVRIVRQMASALDYAHERGFVHQEIKTTNILLGPEGMAKLVDFGVVRAGRGTPLTKGRAPLGTPEYASPEQVAGGAIGSGTDIYALGVVTYEMLSGRVPFSGPALGVLHAHLHESPDLSILPDGVEYAVGKALAKDPGARYTSAGAFAQSLDKAVARQPARVTESLPPTDRPRQERSGLVEGLTEREIEVLRLVAEGCSNKAIAQALAISVNTVKYHMKNILQKLAAENRTEAVTQAIRAGLFRPDSPSFS